MPPPPLPAEWFFRRELIVELRRITNPAVHKTDDEHARDRARAREICAMFRADFPEDVFDLYGKYPP